MLTTYISSLLHLLYKSPLFVNFIMADMRIYLVVIIIRLIESRLQIFTKAAFETGVSTFVFVFYRQVLATLLLAPVALIVYRKKTHDQQLPFKVWFKSFILALIGMLMPLTMHTLGIRYTSATLGSAIANTTPVITFVLATLFGMESVKIRKLWGKAKIFGVALCLVGVGVIAFYTGPHLKPLIHHHLLSRHDSKPATHATKKWILGTFLMIICNTTWALWLILHGPLMKEYSSNISFITYQCFFSTLQSLVLALALERDFSKWNFGLGMGIIGVAYCAIFVTAISFYLQAWCVERKGPVFLAMSTPLTLIITICFSAFLFGEVVNLGRILGGVLMIGGLYSVLWGKKKENMENSIPVSENQKKVSSEECLQEKNIAGKPSNDEESMKVNISSNQDQ